MNSHKKFVYSLGLLLGFVMVSIFSCKQENSLELSDKNRAEMKKDFSVSNSGILSKVDSCTVNVFIDSLKFSETVTKIYDGTVIKNYTCDDNNFSFAVLKRGSENYNFYGHFDVYYLRHSRIKSDSAQFVPFENSKLKLLFEGSNVSMNHEKIKAFLYQLYFENVGDVSQPIFTGFLKKNVVREYVSEEVYSNIDQWLGEDFLIFKDEYFGLIMFRWKFVNQSLEIEESLVPFRKLRYMRSDVKRYSFLCK